VSAVSVKSFQLKTSDFFERNKWIAIVEIAIAVFVAIAIEFGWINQFFIFALLAYTWFSLWLRGKGWSDFGIKKPQSWKNTLLFTVVGGILFQALSLYAIEPLLGKLTGDIPDVSIFRPLVGNVQQLIFWLVISWTFAAFLEEMIYRGYFMHRFADLFKRSNAGWIIGLVLANALFGFGHAYQGASGMIATGIAGLVFSGLFFASKKNLWAAIIAHGIYDTAGFLMIFFGVYPGI
jgi:membrane protease YdiL (CAAX protease family)